VSYMAFRLSYAVLEVRNGSCRPPDFGEYLSFAFFLPTLSVGPINKLSTFQRSLDEPKPELTPPGRAALRVVVGAAKYFVLSAVINQLTYKGLVRDGHPHQAIDWAISFTAYYVYLYCNFSGF